MTRLSTFLVGAAVAASSVVGSAAVAGPVTSAGGTASIGFRTESDFVEVGSKTFTVPYPGAATVEYNGAVAGSDHTAPGGIGRVLYGLDDRGDGATMAVTVFHDNVGGLVTGGDSTFDLPFTTDRPLHYRFVANITDGSFSFSSGLSSGGTAIVDASGRNIPDLDQGSIMEGTIPHDENGFGTFIQEGDLPAGQYRLFAGATSIIESRGRDAISAEGRVQFTLQAEEGPTPNPVPLPPGAWPALGTMAAAAGAGLVRRRRPQAG